MRPRRRRPGDPFYTPPKPPHLRWVSSWGRGPVSCLTPPTPPQRPARRGAPLATLAAAPHPLSACIVVYFLKATPSNPAPEAAEAPAAAAARARAEAPRLPDFPAPRLPDSAAWRLQRIEAPFRELAGTFAVGNSAGFVFAVLIQTPPHCLFQRCANYYLDSRAQSPCPFPSTK